MPIVVASTVSPAGMKAAGKNNVGVISIASTTEAGLAALPTQQSALAKIALVIAIAQTALLAVVLVLHTLLRGHTASG